MASAIQKASGWEFPVGTVLVNVFGCFLIGLLYVWLVARHDPREDLRGLLIVGVMGGFTTFSSFSLETVTLILNGSYANAVLNVVVSVAACLAGTWLAITLARIT
jgi:CrcB protein